MTRPMESVMLATVLRPLLACLSLFSVYVLMHGHTSPGGGFQAGVLWGAGLILAGLVRGREATLQQRAALRMIVAGLAVYAGLGAASMALGREFLDYAALPIAGEPSARRSLGILGIEAGVALAVAGAMVSLFHTLTTDAEEA